MYRSDLDSMVVDQFNKLLIELDEFSQRPFIFDSKTNNTFIYTVHNNLTFLAITTKNTNIMMVFQFLYSLIDLLIYYFKELEEESVRDNFVVIYELLDEIIDNGFPQTTDSKILMDFIKMDSH